MGELFLEDPAWMAKIAFRSCCRALQVAVIDIPSTDRPFDRELERGRLAAVRGGAQFGAVAAREEESRDAGSSTSQGGTRT